MPDTETRGDYGENTCIYRDRKQYGWVWRNAIIVITNILKDRVYIRCWILEGGHTRLGRRTGAQNWQRTKMYERVTEQLYTNKYLCYNTTRAST